MSNQNCDSESPKAWTDAAVVPPGRHQLRVDFSERNAAVLRLARECEDFDVQMVHLPNRRLLHRQRGRCRTEDLSLPEGRRDPRLSEAAREAVIAAIVTDAPVLFGSGPAAAAIALQAVLPEATVLTAGERALMEEWLARLAATEPQAVAASTRSAPSPRLPGRTTRGPRR